MAHAPLDLPSPLSSFNNGGDTLSSLLMFLVAAVSVTASLLYRWSGPDLSGFPTAVEDPGVSAFKKKSRLASGPVGRIIKASYNKFKRPFVMKLSLGTAIILPPRYIDDFKNNKYFDNKAYIVEMFQTKIPGLEPLDLATKEDLVLQAVAKVKMTQSIGDYTPKLVEEAGVAVPRYFSQIGEGWQERPIAEPIIQVMSCLVSLLFVGRDFERRDEWRALSGSYIQNIFSAHHVMRAWPRWSRQFVHWFLPELKEIRRQLRSLKDLLEAHVQSRIAAREQRQRDGEQPARSLDSVDWVLDAAKGRPYDVTLAQLSLTIAALHTSSSTVYNTLLDIVYNEDIIQPLREEAIRVIQEDGGITTQSIAKLELLDSVMKESQRLTPMQFGIMGRIVKQAFKLRDGTAIPKGAMTIVSPPAMLDPEVYDNPEEWDGYRFLKKRQIPGEEKKWLFTSTSPEHHAFGTGMHACPGRFLAATNIKIILVHLLLNYDWRKPEGVDHRPDPVEMSLDWVSNPSVRLAWKPRSPEVAILASHIP